MNTPEPATKVTDAMLDDMARQLRPRLERIAEMAWWEHYRASGRREAERQRRRHKLMARLERDDDGAEQQTGS